MEPTRPVPVRLSTCKKERLPRSGVISPWRGTPGSSSLVTRCGRRRLQNTPVQWQKDDWFVQLLARRRRGSDSWDLKAS
ncbi:hypothetical protein BAE44_0025736, partial [Dichanthelium oligosanthes]